MRNDLDRTSPVPDWLARELARAATATLVVLASSLLLALSASAQAPDGQGGGATHGPRWAADELLVGVRATVGRGRAEGCVEDRLRPPRGRIAGLATFLL